MKILFFTVGLLFSFTTFSQIDTIADHFLLGEIGLTLFDTEQGYVSGNNEYGDVSKMQLFDANHGISGAGTIQSVLLAIPIKVDNGGSYKVKIWENNNGVPGNELGSVTYNISDIDTNFASFYTGPDFLYNVSAPFNVQIPTNGSFWAGVELPTTTGDSIAMFTSDTLFTEAVTHTGEYWSDGTFHFVGDMENWGLPTSFAIFPVVNFISSGIKDLEYFGSIYPNPTSSILNYNFNEIDLSINIISAEGKNVFSKVLTSNIGSIDLSNLEEGVYFYTLTSKDNNKVTDKIVIKK